MTLRLSALLLTTATFACTISRHQPPTWPITKALPGTSFPTVGTVVDTLDGRPVYGMTEQMPVYQAGGSVGLAQFFSRNLRYPYAREDVEGRMYVAIILDQQGRVRRPVIVRSLTTPCDEEVLRLVRLLGPFEPGRQAGQAVDVRLVWSIDFTPH